VDQRPTITIALVGNPNSGKTTLFNALTGAREHVGNYPGVTVEAKIAHADFNGQAIRIVDLPGTYSLTAYTRDELVTRDFLANSAPDVVIDVIDASNLERSLYLTTQLLQLGVKLVLAFNMYDHAESRGFRIDDRKLAKLLGTPIVRTVGHKGQGVAELLAAALALALAGPAAAASQTVPQFGAELEEELTKLTAELAKVGLPPHQTRWAAIKLLEHDDAIAAQLAAQLPAPAMQRLMAAVAAARKHIVAVFRDSPEIVLADRRYGFISGACQEAVQTTVESRHILSDKIDAVLTNRVLGLPIFAFMMYALFQFTFWIGNPIADFLDAGKEYLAGFVRTLGPADSIWVSLLADGVVEGVGAVLVFVPLIALLFLGISLLEDSGYMARAAFVLDRLMHRIGLHGKSFIPMLIGFGCTVPAVLATRTLESRRDRLATMLILPLMSCGARLPAYAMILGAFFPRKVLFRLAGVGVTNQATLLFLIYLIGAGLALLVVRLLRKTLLKGESGSFVMELPPYRLPTGRGLCHHIWQPTWMYMRKAGTVILALVLVMWAGKTWPALPQAQRQTFAAAREQVLSGEAAGPQGDAQLQQINLAQHRAQLTHSAVGRIGLAVAPVLRPCGFDWKVATALIGALGAKEVFVGQMGVIYASPGAGHDSPSLREHLMADYTPLQGFCMMLFILISSPCIATLAATWRESGSWKWPAFQWAYLTVLAWLVTAGAYQVGMAVSRVL
jgi:ferrous iron transport protein B